MWAFFWELCFQSVSSEQKVNALAASFVHSPVAENVDWRLHATISPCHVTVICSNLYYFCLCLCPFWWRASPHLRGLTAFYTLLVYSLCQFGQKFYKCVILVPQNAFCDKYFTFSDKIIRC